MNYNGRGCPGCWIALWTTVEAEASRVAVFGKEFEEEMVVATVSRLQGKSNLDAHSFIDQAEDQLEQSRIANMEGDFARALLFAYRAALRAAGGVISFERSGRRRLPAGSAWVRLRKLCPELEDWIQLFEEHARLAGRVDMGLTRHLTGESLKRVYEDSCDFVVFARARVGYGQQAA